MSFLHWPRISLLSYFIATPSNDWVRKASLKLKRIHSSTILIGIRFFSGDTNLSSNPTMPIFAFVRILKTTPTSCQHPSHKWKRHTNYPTRRWNSSLVCSSDGNVKVVGTGRQKRFRHTDLRFLRHIIDQYGLPVEG